MAQHRARPVRVRCIRRETSSKRRLFSYLPISGVVEWVALAGTPMPISWAIGSAAARRAMLNQTKRQYSLVLEMCGFVRI
jgi:hypothetical protein